MVFSHCSLLQICVLYSSRNLSQFTPDMCFTQDSSRTLLITLEKLKNGLYIADTSPFVLQKSLSLSTSVHHVEYFTYNTSPGT